MRQRPTSVQNQHKQNKRIITHKRPVKRSKRPFGFNVIGYVSRNLGLGVMSRSLIQLLIEHGYPVAIHDLNPIGVFHKRFDESYKDLFVQSVDKLPYAINLFTLPARDATEFLFFDLSRLLRRHHSLNVFCPMWELDIFPVIWVKALQLCDVIVSQSDFVSSTCAKYLPELPILSAEQPLYFPRGVKACRARFGLPEDATIFVFSFEPRSDIERKNPSGLIKAFRRAFRNQSSAHLVIKVNNAYGNECAHSVVKQLKALSNNDPRIHLITEDLTYLEILNLYASCDVFVSLHRSEGLGLGMMEAMQLGKPVIATAWSGNMTYMNDANSCLVRYKLIPAKGIIKCYQQHFVGKNAFWANPDIDDAAAWMRKLADNVNLRKSIGTRAARDMAHYQKQARRGFFIEKIRDLWHRKVSKT
ncbi:MAG: glycosyltransferase family 4 protein [Candidatus Omnitrophica bacterium]|nr:glycosyltransferase family 4 protein [Candidatus Omnitrophota bacterium]